MIQPFDRGAYDKRYEDVFEPAIRAAGLEPYRVDRDRRTTIPIESIEDGIRSADICFAEITSDNPNVWFELGFSLASRKPVVLVCAEERDRFPFDIQHRQVVRYKTESTSDFEAAEAEITSRLKAALVSREALAEVTSSSVVAEQSGLTPEQLSALVLVAQRMGSSGDAITVYELNQQMGSVGFTGIATTLAVRGLDKKGFVESFTDSNFNGEEYTALRATEQGLDWLEINKDKLVLRRSPKGARPAPTDPSSDIDALPF